MNRRFPAMMLTVALATVWAAPDTCRAGAPVILGGYMALNRDSSERVVLGQGGGEFTTDQAAFAYRSGLWAMLGWRISDCFMFDGSFQGLPQWTERVTVLSDGATPVTSPYLNISGPAVTGLRFEYHSDLTSFDLNARGILGSEDCLWVSFFGGFRYFSYQEDFDLEGARGAAEINPGELTPAALERTRVRTTNRMYGGQFGGDVNAAIANCFGITGYAKGGFMANDAEARISNVLFTEGTGNLGRLGFQVRDTIPAYFLEGGVQFLLRFSDHIELKGGYRVLFLTGLALAPEQLAANQTLFSRTILTDSTSTFGDSGLINRDGNVFFHGPFLGLELHW